MTFIAVSCAMLLFLLPHRTQDFLWNGYRVVVLPKKANTLAICKALAAVGITDVITENSVLDRSIVEADWSTDLNKQVKWFYNASEEVQYMYLPQAASVTKASSVIKKTTTPLFFEQAFFFPFGQFFFIAGLFLLCGIISTEKIMFVLTALPFAVYGTTIEGIPAVTSALLMVYEAALLNGLCTTTVGGSFIMRLRKHVPMLAPILAAAVFSAFASIGLYFCLALGTALASMGMYIRLKTIRLHGRSRSCTLEIRTRFHLIAISIATALCIFFSVFFLYRQNKTVPSEITMPIPSLRMKDFSTKAFSAIATKKKDTDFFDLTDYVREQWLKQIEPYTTEYSAGLPYTGQRIDFFDFTIDKRGYMTEHKKNIAVFNHEFIQQALGNMKKTGIKKLLFEQSSFVTATYSILPTHQGHNDDTVLLWALLLILCPGGMVITQIVRDI